jgi:hypothetical protein
VRDTAHKRSVVSATRHQGPARAAVETEADHAGGVPRSSDSRWVRPSVFWPGAAVNISGTSVGPLSGNAIQALVRSAHLAGCLHNTFEVGDLLNGL